MLDLGYELERLTDNDNEPELDLQRLWAGDTVDLGALEVCHIILFTPWNIIKI